VAIASRNPTNGETVRVYEPLSAEQRTAIVRRVSAAQTGWSATPIRERAAALARAGRLLRERRDQYAGLITLEMGKPIREARTEIEKCAWGCEFYAEHAPPLLADEPAPSDAGRSFVAYQPLGTLLAIMPWNFPFWQLFRAAVPAIAAGNTVLLKHASNVPQCALAIEEVFRDAFPPDVLRTLLIGPEDVEPLIADPGVQAVTLTGSEAAGRQVAAAAGRNLKKSVLELGGSDAFVVLTDADLDLAVAGAVASRFQNTGQSCIAAKRMILAPEIAAAFVDRLRQRIATLRIGDPAHEATELGPLARPDLRDALHRQVTESVRLGAVLLAGGGPLPGPGSFYPPSLLDGVRPGMPAHDEELFGPVAAVIRARDEADALSLANNHRYGLGASLWTRDVQRGERLARQLQSGQAFVNGIVKSDPRLPFGGIKASGYGRELAAHGIREFVNIKTVWVK
jgi:succinate-semialdehyde dehydrogenase/glutarate-semialdehyde dehydrogenase